jgi:hypothetical protein
VQVLDREKWLRENPVVWLPGAKFTNLPEDKRERGDKNDRFSPGLSSFYWLTTTFRNRVLVMVLIAKRKHARIDYVNSEHSRLWLPHVHVPLVPLQPIVFRTWFAESISGCPCADVSVPVAMKF